MEASQDGSSYPKGCHKVGTDALVCPHKAGKLVADLADSGGQTRASVPTGWNYHQLKERPSQFEEGVSLQ